VDTAVDLTREIPSARAAAGFVNAVLRGALRAPVALPPRDADELGYLAAAYSHPRLLAAKSIEWFGTADAEPLMAVRSLRACTIRMCFSRAPMCRLRCRYVPRRRRGGSRTARPTFAPAVRSFTRYAVSRLRKALASCMRF